MPIKYRVCSGPCGRSLPHTDFWKDAKQPDGRMKRCVDCTTEARKDRAQRRSNGEVVPTVSDEQRRELSERAKRLNAEGRLGGAKFTAMADHSGRKKKVTETLLDWARDHPQLLISVIERNLRSRNRSVSMRALEHLTKLEIERERVDQSARGAGKAPDEMTQSELEEFVTQALLAQIESGTLDISGTVIDGVARDVDEVPAE